MKTHCLHHFDLWYTSFYFIPKYSKTNYYHFNLNCNFLANNPTATKQVAAAAAAGWASSNQGTYTPPSLPGGDVEAQQASQQAANDFNVDPETLKLMGRYHLALRLLYVTTSVFLGVAAGLSLVNQTNLGIIFFAFYVLFFSLLICCFETGLSVSITNPILLF